MTSRASHRRQQGYSRVTTPAAVSRHRSRRHSCTAADTQVGPAAAAAAAAAVVAVVAVTVTAVLGWFASDVAGLCDTSLIDVVW